MVRLQSHRSILALLCVAMLLVQYGCAVDRLRKPIEDFQAATSVVTAQARLAYAEVNRIERLRAIKTAQRLHQPLRLDTLRAETTFFTGEDLAARLDALDHLGQYAGLLSQIVNSDAPEKIAASAGNLENSLNVLATRINGLANPPATADSAAADSKPNTKNFKEKFGVFTRTVTVVLGLLAKKKQNDALKSAVKDADVPVSDLIDAIKLDLNLDYKNKQVNLEHDMTEVFKAYNKELENKPPDAGRLDQFADAIISNLDAVEAFNATNPSDSLEKMKEAHKKMVAYANNDSDGTLNDALASIQLFVGSATRLGEAVVKLRSTGKNKDNS